MVKINFISKISILSCNFKVVWNKESDGGSFDWDKAEIVIGIKSYKNDPLYTLHVISHELMELILNSIGGRYHNSRDHDFVFVFSHLSFETAIKIHTQALSEFIAYSK